MESVTLKPGVKIGRLTVIENITGSGRSKVRCICDCGNEWVGQARSLKSGNTQSCGCLQKDAQNESHTKHGKCGTRLYRIWALMIQRCENPKRENYKYYGGRGIAVCAEWHNFETFYEWATLNGYADNLEIDRIDSDCSYSPLNCRWVTRKENTRNTRSNHFVKIGDVTKTIAEWAELTGIRAGTIQRRIATGKSGSELLVSTGRSTKKCREERRPE